MDSQIIAKMVRKSTGKWAKQRKAEERNQTRTARRWEALIKTRRITIREAAWSVMRKAYMKASANNTLPAAARQIMYAGRGEIQEMTGRQLDDKYFTQTLLPDYLSNNPNETSDWDVVFDARGTLHEPHTEKSVPLGTLNVRQYLEAIRNHTISGYQTPNLEGSLFPSCGPANRFGAILFIEKEGFMPLFKKVQLAERYDIAIMSTKGLSVTAARSLVDELCDENARVPLLIVRDFDKAGFSIAGTLQRNTRRFEFRNAIEAVDFGLRLEDVNQYDLESEFVSYGKTNPQQNLLKNGATQEEIEFLFKGHDWTTGYNGQRVELNALASDQLVAWIETKLEANHIKKVIPGREGLENAYRRALAHKHFQDALDQAAEEVADIVASTVIPKELEKQIADQFKIDPTKSWDQVIPGLLVE